MDYLKEDATKKQTNRKRFAHHFQKYVAWSAQGLAMAWPGRGQVAFKAKPVARPWGSLGLPVPMALRSFGFPDLRHWLRPQRHWAMAWPGHGEALARPWPGPAQARPRNIPLGTMVIFLLIINNVMN